MDSGTMGIVGDCEDDDGGQDGDSSGDLMGLKGGKGKQGMGQHNGYCYLCGQWRDTAKNCESTATVCCICGQWRYGKVVPCKRKVSNGR